MPKDLRWNAIPIRKKSWSGSFADINYDEFNQYMIHMHNEGYDLHSITPINYADNTISLLVCHDR